MFSQMWTLVLRECGNNCPKQSATTPETTPTLSKTTDVMSHFGKHQTMIRPLGQCFRQAGCWELLALLLDEVEPHLGETCRQIWPMVRSAWLRRCWIWACQNAATRFGWNWCPRVLSRIKWQTATAIVSKQFDTIAVRQKLEMKSEMTYPNPSESVLFKQLYLSCSIRFLLNNMHFTFQPILSGSLFHGFSSVIFALGLRLSLAVAWWL